MLSTIKAALTSMFSDTVTATCCDGFHRCASCEDALRDARLRTRIAALSASLDAVSGPYDQAPPCPECGADAELIAGVPGLDEPVCARCVSELVG